MLKGFEHNYVLSQLQNSITDTIILGKSSKERDVLKELKERCHIVVSQVFAGRKDIKSYVSTLLEIHHEIKKIEIAPEAEDNPIGGWEIHSDVDETTITNHSDINNTLDIISKDTHK